MGFWNRIKKAMEKPIGASIPVPISNKPVGRSNPQPIGNVVMSYDVQSWAPDLHPNGRERSSLVQDIEYKNGKLDVTYNDGFTAEYDGITPQEAKEFAQDESKGRWARNHLWNKPYKEV